MLPGLQRPRACTALAPPPSAQKEEQDGGRVEAPHASRIVLSKRALQLGIREGQAHAASRRAACCRASGGRHRHRRVRPPKRCCPPAA